MQKSLFAIATFALACSESHPAELVETSTGEANVSCSLGCGLERFTLSVSDVVLEFPGDDPRSEGGPLNIGKFACDSPQIARSFVGTAIDDRDPQTVGQWYGDLGFSAAPSSQSGGLIDGPFSLGGAVQLPDGRTWIGFIGALWDPGARSCEIVDGVMRIRVKSRIGAAVQTATPNGDVATGSVAGFIEGHLDVTDPLTVISSSFTVRTLGAKDPATVTLSPSLATPELGATQTLAATVVDYGTGAPGSSGLVANQSVVFAIVGATTQTLSCITDATGRCRVRYASPVAGSDSVTAFADINGDGTLGLGEPSASAEVKWGDASPPVVTTPPPVVAEAQGPSGAVVTFEPPGATDDVGVVGVVQCNPPSGSLFQLGSTQVTCEASDAAGNTGSASFEVSVVDTTAPSIAFSGNAGTYTVDQTVAIECTATDLVTASPSVTCSGGSGPAYAFNLGANEVAATAVDDAGNQSTASSPFVVNVTVEGICRLTSRWLGHSGGGTAPCKSLDALSGRLPPAQRARVIDLFIRAVERESGRKLPADQAAILIRLASAL